MNICMFAKGLPVHTKEGIEIHVKELAKGCFEKVYKVRIDILKRKT